MSTGRVFCRVASVRCPHAAAGRRNKALRPRPSMITFEPQTKDILKRAQKQLRKQESPLESRADPELRVPLAMRRPDGPTPEEIALLRSHRLLRAESTAKQPEELAKLEDTNPIAAAALLRSCLAASANDSLRQRAAENPIESLSGAQGRRMLRHVVAPEAGVLRLIAQERVAKHLADRRAVGSGSVRQQLGASCAATTCASPLKFVAAANDTKDFYDVREKREIAFIGRSNVGKSMLINTIFNTGAARVADTPGVTQTINWYAAGAPLDTFVVDMPGYGFAYVDDLVQKSWKPLIFLFLTRPSLSRLFVLIDARHGFKKADRDFLASLPPNVKLSVVMSKCDLVEKNDLARRYQLIREELRARDAANCDIYMVSATMGSGIESLRSALLSAR